MISADSHVKTSKWVGAANRVLNKAHGRASSGNAVLGRPAYWEPFFVEPGLARVGWWRDAVDDQVERQAPAPPNCPPLLPPPRLPHLRRETLGPRRMPDVTGVEDIMRSTDFP